VPLGWLLFTQDNEARLLGRQAYQNNLEEELDKHSSMSLLTCRNPSEKIIHTVSLITRLKRTDNQVNPLEHALLPCNPFVDFLAQ